MSRLFLIFALLFAAAFPAVAGSSDAYVWHNVKIGEPMTTAYCMHRAADGMAWIGTNHGLYTYDGYRARHVLADAPLFDSQVYGVVELSDTCYLGTNNGLLRFIPASQQGGRVAGDLPIEIRSILLTGDTLRVASLYGLYDYVPRTGAAGPSRAVLPHRAVYALVEVEPGGDLYIGTYEGLCRYSQRTGRSERVALPVVWGKEFVNALAFDAAAGVLWVGMENGLVRYDIRTGRAERVPAYDDISVKSLAVRPGGGIAVGTGGGLYLSAGDGSTVLCRHDSRVDTSISDDAIWALSVDDEGNVWAATEMGMSIGNADAAVRVVRISDITGRGDGQVVYHFLRDSRGALWIGGSNGLICSAPGGLQWFSPGDEGAMLSHSRVRDIYETPRGELWAATDVGLNRYDRSTGRFIGYRVHDRNGNFKANWAYGVDEDSTGALWVGSYLGGIHVVERATLDASPRGGDVRADLSFNSSSGLHNDFIGSMRRASDGAMWVKLFRDSAITLVDARRGSVERFPLAAEGVLPAAIVGASDGSVWVGHDRGVVQVDRVGRVLRRVSFPAHTADERMLAMERVGGELWISTVHALWALDMASLELSLLPVPERAYTAIYHDVAAGKVLLGTTDEYVEVEPGLLHASSGDARLHVVGMEVDGTEVAVADGVKLPHGFRSLVVELSCLDYTPGHYRKFAYRLDGEDAWTLLPVGDNRVELRTLPVGAHRLAVMVAGVPESERSIGVDVLPPWYLSRPAWIAYVILIAAGVSAGYVYARRARRRELLEAERRRTLAEVENRIRLLGNISHDLKTPLSMIMGPAGKLREQCGDDAARRDLDTIYTNALKLNALIHRSVELDTPGSAGDADQLLIYSRTDLGAFVADIVRAWADRDTGRTISWDGPQQPVRADVDVVKIESIVNNLVGNAVKYTAEGARIDVSLAALEGGAVVLRVADNGPGIPADDLPLIFRRHFRSPVTAGTHEGTGIGLYLVRHYAELHGGSVQVESSTEAGCSHTVFTVVLPVGTEADDCAAASHAGGKTGRILVVDDNREIARFVASLLGGDFDTLTASDGASALAEAARFVPDVVVTDYQMPGMSGAELCRRIHSTEALRHVPVVVLTGIIDPTGAVEAECVDAGADLFLSKPFDGALLRRRIVRIVERSRAVRHDALLAQLADSEPVEAESLADKQIGAINDIIEANIANPDLNVAFLSEQSGVHTKQLYRLVKDRLGVTPVEYIRQMRLRKAAHLLDQRRFSVGEVMYMVGFSSASYFSKCFQAQFGCKPRDYSPSPF